jgi:hypothetical protein
MACCHAARGIVRGRVDGGGSRTEVRGRWLVADGLQNGSARRVARATSRAWRLFAQCSACATRDRPTPRLSSRSSTRWSASLADALRTKMCVGRVAETYAVASLAVRAPAISAKCVSAQLRMAAIGSARPPIGRRPRGRSTCWRSAREPLGRGTSRRTRYRLWSPSPGSIGAHLKVPSSQRRVTSLWWRA